MLQLEPDGRLVFTILASEAQQVELLGAFRGWHVERVPMHRQPDGRWSVELDLAPGAYRYRFCVDGREIVDDHAHGTRFDAEGRPWSRAWRPDWTWAEAGFPASTPTLGRSIGPAGDPPAAAAA